MTSRLPLSLAPPWPICYTGGDPLDIPSTTVLRLIAEENWYLRWRMDRASIGFSEKPDQAPPEALLQQVWLYQRLVQERLRTTDGRRVRVLHPGFWNHEPGPDFRKALIQIGTEPPVSGDIEIDLVPAGWEQHSHARNPAYRNVVLHVTWEPESAPAGLPSLCLKHALDSTLPELAFWLGLEPKPAPQGLAGKCSGPLRNLPEGTVAQILRQAAQARLIRKAELLQARARQFGWNGALWEALCGALGYKRNVWPMRRLGEVFPAIREDLGTNLGTNLETDPASIFTLQARFLGVAGLMPAQLPSGGAGEYLLRVWNIWWREAERFHELKLPAAAWTLGGIRPANHPQRRVATVAHWAARTDLPRQFEEWLERTIESPDLAESLLEIAQVKHDPFWSYRWTMKSAPFSQPRPLLGAQRITDLAINVVLPWLYVRALAGKNEALARTAESRYFLWPAGEDNSVLKLARQRLFGGVSSKFLKTAAHQQGVLQIVRDFCDYSDSACHQCQFPEMVNSSSSAGCE